MQGHMKLGYTKSDLYQAQYRLQQLSKVSGGVHFTYYLLKGDSED